MVWTKFSGEKDSWKRLSLIGDETVINLQSTKVYVFSDSVLCLGGGSFNILNPTKPLEEKGCRSPIREKLQRL